MKNYFLKLTLAFLGSMLLFSCDINKRLYINGYKTAKPAQKIKTDNYDQHLATFSPEETVVMLGDEIMIASVESDESRTVPFIADKTSNSVKNTPIVLPKLKKNVPSAEKKMVPTLQKNKQKVVTHSTQPTESDKPEIDDEVSVPKYSILGLSFGITAMIGSLWGLVTTLMYENFAVWMTFLGIGSAIAIAGLVMSIMGLVKIIQDKKKYGGKGFSVGGIVLASIGIFFFSIMAFIGLMLF